MAQTGQEAALDTQDCRFSPVQGQEEGPLHPGVQTPPMRQEIQSSGSLDVTEHRDFAFLWMFSVNLVWLGNRCWPRVPSFLLWFMLL